LGLSTTSWSV